MNVLAHIAAQRAREVLKIGDRVQVDHCPAGRITVTMTGWSTEHPDYFTSATHDDLIQRLGIRELATMEFISHELSQAGPVFCRAYAIDEDADLDADVPF